MEIDLQAQSLINKLINSEGTDNPTDTRVMVLRSSEKYIATLDSKSNKWKITDHRTDEASTFTFSQDFLSFEHQTSTHMSKYTVSDYKDNVEKDRLEFKIISDTGQLYTMIWDKGLSTIRFIYAGVDGEKHQIKYIVEENAYEEPGPDSEFGANPWKGNGSGFFLHEDGYLATNYHVIEDAKDIQIEYSLKDKWKALQQHCENHSRDNHTAILIVI